jgi:hypothetical protein
MRILFPMNSATRPAPLPVPFTVLRPCEEGMCPVSRWGACDCFHPYVDVDVDELTEAEVTRFLREGTPAQRAELRAWLDDGVEDGPGLAKCEPDVDDVRELREEMAADLRAAGW